MDLGAYAQIDDLEKIMKDNNIDIPRLRGLRLMKDEKPLTKAEREDIIKEDILWEVQSLIRGCPKWDWNSCVTELSSKTDALCDYYLWYDVDEYGCHKYIDICWDRIHGKNNIGYPSFCLLRKNGDRFKIIKSYIIYFYNALRKNNQLEYHRTEKIEWLDNYFGENMNVVRWVLFAKNREKLYSSEKNRVCYYIIQQIKYRRELKTVTFTNDRYERFMLFVNDLAVLFEKDTTLLQK